MGRRDDVYSNDSDGAEFHESQYAEYPDEYYDVLSEADGYGEEDMEEPPVRVGKILVTAKLIVALIRYELLPPEWRSKYNSKKGEKLKSRQMAHIDREDFETLAEALEPIVEGKRKLETNQMRYVHEVYDILAREIYE